MKQKQIKKIITLLVVVSLVMVFGSPPILEKANAVDSIKDARDLISDSDPGQTATHTFGYETNHNPGADGYIEFAFPVAFGNIAANGDITCAGGGAASGAGSRTARCTYAGSIAAGPATTTIANMVNPAANEYVIIISSYASTSVLLERVEVMIAIIEDVWMTARVAATLNFVIEGVDSGQSANGVNCDETTSATATPFGNLDILTPKTVCQQLTVSTNAGDGFAVTVWASDELRSDSSANINSFNNSPDATGSTTPMAWAQPTGELDQYHTYGHMGLTSQDQSLSNGDHFGNSLYVGFNSNDPVEVMYHNGPANGTVDHISRTRVAYTAEISALQEAGDYETTLTYICTPVY